MSEDLTGRLCLERSASGGFGPERVRLLQAIKETGSISAGGRRLGMSFRGAWNAVQSLNRLFGTPLIVARPGGKKGGGAGLTQAGQRFLSEYDALSASLQEAVARLEHRVVGDGTGDVGPEARWIAKISEVDGTELRLVTVAGLPIVAHRPKTLSGGSLTVGMKAAVCIPSPAVVLARPGVGQTSARNAWRSQVLKRVEHLEGVSIELETSVGDRLSALVTRCSADALALAPGAAVCALVKATQVELQSL